MERVHVNGVELEYDVHGSGEPVLLVHGGLLADENTPLALEPALTERYMVINYHRRGFAGSSRPAQGQPPATIETHVADAKSLLDELGVEKTHVVGHSLGGTISIQLALDHPDSVHTLALMEPRFKNAITVERDYGEIPRVRCYAGQLNQVFLNLLMNACDAMKRKDPAQRGITVKTLHASDGCVELLVTDTGPGLDPATLDLIFDPFYTTKENGLGLGLSISRKIAQAHGGTLSVESRRGAGATFRLKLPALQRETETASMDQFSA